MGVHGSDLRLRKQPQNGLIFLALPVEGFTLSPFWLAYAIVLVVLFVWASRLVKEADARDERTTDREIAPLLRDVERERSHD